MRNRQDRMRIPEKSVRDLLRRSGNEIRVRTSGHPMWRPGSELAVGLLSSGEMRALNARHTGRDRVTDVLSFDYGAENPDGSCGNWSGEILVCPEEAARRAPEFGNTPGRELATYLVHGLLHLSGMDDGTPEERGRMRDEERRILSLVQETVDVDRAFAQADDEADTPGGPP